MKLLLTLVFFASLGLLAAAQAPVATGPATVAPSASRSMAASGTRVAEAHPGRSPGIGLPARSDSGQSEQTQPTVHRSHHWLRWAIVSVAAIAGVIAIIAYKRNEGTTVNMGGP